MLLEVSNLSVPIQLDQLFGRHAPVEIEIGVGKGRFLREYASAYPDKNLLGLEKAYKWLKHAEVRLTKAQLTNIRLIPAYVEGFLERFVLDDEIDAYHIYFPDPWPKRKHHKHRIFKSQLLFQILRTLKPDGQLFIATDHREYFDEISSVLRSFSINGLIPKPWDSGTFKTNFQVKYEKEGRPIYFVRAVNERSAMKPVQTQNAA